MNGMVFAIAAATLVGTSFGVVEGLPKGFDLSFRPMESGTQTYLEDGDFPVTVYPGMDGEWWCKYLDGVDVKGVVSPDGESFGCPAVTLWHLRDVNVEKLDGKCGGMLCRYDYAIPGDWPKAETIRRVDWCPDVVVTVRTNGYVRIVGGLNFETGDDPRPYYNNGTIPMSFDGEPELVECGGDRYRRQRKFWLEDYMPPGYHVETRTVETPSWDGK